MEITEWLPAIGAVITALIIPFAVNLCVTVSMSGTAKRVLAIVFSVLGGLAIALTTGTPTPDNLVMWCLAVLGGVQAAYTAFKAVGVTSGMLDALLGIGNTDDEEDVDDTDQ